MGGMSLSALALLVLGPVLVWRIYARIKAMMVRQESVLSRHWLAVLVGVAVLVATPLQIGPDLPALAGLGAGAVFGIGWGLYGFRRTRLEAGEAGYRFTPWAPLGMAVAMLFVARILYIGFDLYLHPGGGAALMGAPLTTAAIGLVTGYFLTISAGLLRWRLRNR
jgi:hypothetical protein